MSNMWYPKQKPLLGLTGLGGGSDSLGFVGAAKNNDAGKYTSDTGSLCQHFYQLGVNTDTSGYGGTDVGSSAGGAYARDLVLNDTSNAGTPMSTVGNMPPGIAYARHLSTTAEANNFWKSDDKAFGFSGNYWFIQFFFYPTGSIGNQSSGWWQPFKQGYTGRTYVNEYWVDYNNNSRFDVSASDYNSRAEENTSWFSDMPAIDTWNFIRFGKDSSSFRTEYWTWDGSTWTENVDQSESGYNVAGPEGISDSEYLYFWTGDSNRGQTGYVANMSQGSDNIWGEGVPTGVVP